MAMATPILLTARRLPAVGPDVAKTLTTVALCRPVLGSISFDFVIMLLSAVNLKLSGAFRFLARVTRRREREERGVYGPSFWSGTFGNHLFYTGDVVVYLLKNYSDVLCRCIARQMHDNSFNRFILFCVKYKEVEIFPVVHHTFSCDPGSGFSVPEEELSAHDTF
jgi:hypothetical protein